MPKAPALRNTVVATGRRNHVMCGLTTDVRLVFPAIDAVADGFNVQAAMDASGSLFDDSEQFARERMQSVAWC
jgi:nicotinamidase-related amidase